MRRSLSKPCKWVSRTAGGCSQHQGLALGSPIVFVIWEFPASVGSLRPRSTLMMAARCSAPCLKRDGVQECTPT